MRILISLLLSLLSISIYAKPVVLPTTLLNCKLNQVYLDKLDIRLNKITPKNIPQVYLIQNTSVYTLVLDHPKGSAGMGAGWSSVLAPKNWSAIAISQTGFNVRCYINQQGKTYQAGCKLLRICQPVSGLVGKSNGNYWVVENESWSGLVKGLKAKGIMK